MKKMAAGHRSARRSRVKETTSTQGTKITSCKSRDEVTRRQFQTEASPFAQLLLGDNRSCIIEPHINGLRQITLKCARHFTGCRLERFFAGLLKFRTTEMLAGAINNVIE